MSTLSQFDEVIAEFLEAIERGEKPDRRVILEQHPELRTDLNNFFRDHDEMCGVIEPDSIENQATVQFSKSKTRKPLGKRVESNDDSQKRMIGSYQVLEEIDRGGMGIVFKALDPALNRTVALKIIRSGKLASESDVQRFHAEAKAAAKLDHPGIVSVHEVGNHQGQPFFSMAFIEGKNLGAYHAEKKLSVREACAMVREIAIAIDHAHENGLVHRDLKPANILIDKGGAPRVTDFGLAKVLGNDDGLTGTGEILGTVNYMAPEQAAARSDQVDRMTDVYSLGAMLYYLCTGHPPFETENPVDTLLRILDAEPTLASQINKHVPKDVAMICQRCLEKKPSDRYPTAKALAEELDRFLHGEPINASTKNIQSAFRRWSRREPSLAGHLIGLGLIELTRAISYSIGVAFLGYGLDQYLRYTYVILIWAATCFVLQKIQNSLEKNSEAFNYANLAWTAADISFLTYILWIVDGIIGPLYVAYPLVIVVSGLFSRVRMVVFTTIVCLLSFTIVFLRKESLGIENSHYGAVGFPAIIVIGYVMCLLVHRIRLLNRLFESEK